MAINSNSKLRDIVSDPRAVEIVDKYSPGFMNESERMGPCMGMKFAMLIKFPQVGMPADVQKQLCDELDALDA